MQVRIQGRPWASTILLTGDERCFAVRRLVRHSALGGYDGIRDLAAEHHPPDCRRWWRITTDRAFEIA
jgi:hypothetical protein